MTTKSDYTTEEWIQLLQAPSAVGIYIMMSDPSFVIGTMKEAWAVSGSILQKEKEKNSELLAALLAEFKERETVRQTQFKFDRKDVRAAQQMTFAALKKVVRILDEKAGPEEAAEIKSWLYDVSVKAAAAAKEGGFLGVGGERVSENEKTALSEIAGQLGVST